MFGFSFVAKISEPFVSICLMVILLSRTTGLLTERWMSADGGGLGAVRYETCNVDTATPYRIRMLRADVLVLGIVKMGEGRIC